MRKVLVVGAGRVGRTIVHMLDRADDYQVELCDSKPDQAARIVAPIPNVIAFDGDASKKSELLRALKGKAP